MNSHVHPFYHEGIDLQEAPDLSWEDALKKAPSLPKGWYELSRLKSADRIEFTRDYWLATLPFFPHVHEFIQQFFGKLDDVGVFLVKPQSDSAFECEFVYSLRDGSCFYRGLPPSSDEEIERLKVDFNEVLPQDYLSFLKIHDGFGKHTDIGILPSHRLDEIRKQLSEDFELVLDPTSLIPFYKSSNKPCYQCFFAEWSPMGEPGNVYCSADEMISDITDKNSWVENLAFPTFLDWLIYYFESIE